MLPALYHMVASWLTSHGTSEPQVEVETTSVFATIEMLNHSELLSILPKNVTLACAELGKVALGPDGDLPAHYPIGVIYRMEALVNPMMKVVLRAARECVSEG